MKNLTGIFALLILAFFSSPSNADLLFAESDLNASTWPAKCEATKSALSDSKSANYRFAGALDTSSEGKYPIQFYGFNIQIEYFPISIRIDAVEENGDVLVLKGTDGQLVVLTKESNRSAIQSLFPPLPSSVAAKIFEPDFSYSQLIRTGLSNSPNDVSCETDRMFEDAKTLLAIDAKGAIDTIAPNMEAAYIVNEENWSGYAVCFPRDFSAVLRIHVSDGRSEILGTIATTGKCKNLWSTRVDDDQMTP